MKLLILQAFKNIQFTISYIPRFVPKENSLLDIHLQAYKKRKKKQSVILERLELWRLIFCSLPLLYHLVDIGQKCQVICFQMSLCINLHIHRITDSLKSPCYK